MARLSGPQRRAAALKKKKTLAEQNKVKNTNKATNKLRKTISKATAEVKGTGHQKRSGGKAKLNAQKKLAEQFKTKGAGKSIQSKLVKAGHSQTSLDIKRAQHSLSKADRAEMNRLRRGTAKERELYKEKKKKERQKSNRDALKAGSSTWD